MAQSWQLSGLFAATILTLNLTAHASALQFSHNQSGIRYQGIGKFEQEAWGPYGLSFDEQDNAITFDAVSHRMIHLGMNGKVLKKNFLGSTISQAMKLFDASAWRLLGTIFSPMKSQVAKVQIANTSVCGKS